MSKIKQNLNQVDRSIRGLISIVLLFYVALYSEQIGEMLLLIIIVVFAILNLISFFIGWCPVYKVANISTYKPKSVENDE